MPSARTSLARQDALHAILFTANGNQTKKLAMDKIYFFTLARGSLTRRVDQVIEWFLEMKH